VEAWDYLAKCFLATGRTADALAAYRSALPHSPRPAQIYYNLGSLYAGMGDEAQAVRHLEQALQIDPNGPLVTRILQKLNEVRSSDRPSPG